MSNGTVTRPDGVEIEIKNFIRGFYPEGKTIAIIELVDNTMVLVVENPPESALNPRQILSLTRESYEGLMSFAMMHEIATGSRLEKNVDAQDGVEYNHSDNLFIPSK